jgi:aminoglycoside 2'-N-acetyltransferase I
VTTIQVVQREDLSEKDLASLLAWLEEAFGDAIGSWRRETWTDIGPGPHFMLRDAEGQLRAHACIDWLPMMIGERLVHTGYLEAVATRADSRRQGFASQVVEAAQREIVANAEIGFLATGEHSFYERLGWIRWRGATWVTERDGSVTRTPAEDAGIMAFMLPTTPAWIQPTMSIRRPRRDPEEPW